ncbi:MAG TPA: endonuclease/exonuclease/phosphatase family protein [Terracidiphilus sp.]|nr:endonuclease/exonuclease/phosphatase family protein [Terracidiphilus sp.]
MGHEKEIRVATYNVHKCRGFDGKISPPRIISVIKELDADILCLQEVVNAPGNPVLHGSPRVYDQAGEIARAMSGYAWAFGANRPLHGGVYGNMTLTRLPIQAWRNYDLTRPERSREERGVLQTEIEIARGKTLHVFNVHLGTGPVERRFQGEKLLGKEILSQPGLNGPRLVLGDFNEWTRGQTTRRLKKEFQSFRPHHVLRFPRTFPGLLPFLSLDHFYYELPLQLENARLFRARRALVASDHLPLIADFRIQDQVLS